MCQGKQRPNRDARHRGPRLRFGDQVSCGTADMPVPAIGQHNPDPIGTTRRSRWVQEQALTIKAMPPISDRNLRNKPIQQWGIVWCSGRRRHSAIRQSSSLWSPGPRSAHKDGNIGQHIASGNSAQVQWIRVTAPHHPWLGRVVRVIRRLRRDAGTDLVVEGEDGHRQMMPLAWTEAARVEEPVMPVLRFTPGSLRALVRLVDACRTSPRAEARHANPDPDPVEHSAARGPEADGCAVERPAATPADGPDGPQGDAP